MLIEIIKRKVVEGYVLARGMIYSNAATSAKHSIGKAKTTVIYS
jgi:hypothetical protein